MRPRDLPLVLLAAGFFAAAAISRRAPASRNDRTSGARAGHVPRFILAKDVPALGLRQGEQLRVEPEALIYVGDIVALRSDEPEIVLARFHDELMHCVAGLVVRETETAAV